MSTMTTMIEGVQVVPLRRIPDERGTVMHMLKRGDPHFKEFGEIYFSTIYQGVVKGYPDGSYQPAGVVTRDQMAVYVARAFKLQ